MWALKVACENFENPVFPNAMVRGASRRRCRAACRPPQPRSFRAAVRAAAPRVVRRLTAPQIAGDCVITHLLGRLGYLESGKCKVMVVDTFHLFDETVRATAAAPTRPLLLCLLRLPRHHHHK